MRPLTRGRSGCAGPLMTHVSNLSVSTEGDGELGSPLPASGPEVPPAVPGEGGDFPGARVRGRVLLAARQCPPPASLLGSREKAGLPWPFPPTVTALNKMRTRRSSSSFRSWPGQPWGHFALRLPVLEQPWERGWGPGWAASLPEGPSRSTHPMGWSGLQFAAVEMLGLELPAGLGCCRPCPDSRSPGHAASALSRARAPLSPTEQCPLLASLDASSSGASPSQLPGTLSAREPRTRPLSFSDPPLGARRRS